MPTVLGHAEELSWIRPEITPSAVFNNVHTDFKDRVKTYFDTSAA